MQTLERIKTKDIVVRCEDKEIAAVIEGELLFSRDSKRWQRNLIEHKLDEAFCNLNRYNTKSYLLTAVR